MKYAANLFFRCHVASSSVYELRRQATSHPEASVQAPTTRKGNGGRRRPTSLDRHKNKYI